MTLILQSTLWCIVCFLLFYLTGKVLLRQGETDPRYSSLLIFGRVSLGAVLWVVLAAAYWTGGNTSMWLIFMVVVIPLVRYRPWTGPFTRRYFAFEKQYARVGLWTVALAGVLVTIQAAVFIQEEALVIPHMDWQFYAHVAELLPGYGIENHRLWLMDYFPDATPQTLYYHFFDIWLIALLSKVSGMSAIHAYMYVYIPLFGVVILWGLVGLFEYFAQRRVAWLPLLFPVLFYAGKVPFFSEGLSRTLFSTPKILPVYLVLIALVVVLYERKWLAAAALACGLALANVTFAPALFSGAFVIGLWQVWKGDGWQRSKGLLLLPVVATAALVVFYFLIHPQPTTAYQSGGEDRTLADWLFGVLWTTVISSRALYLPLLYLPLFLVLLLNLGTFRKKWKDGYGRLFIALALLLACTFAMTGIFTSLNLQFIQLARLFVNPFMVALTVAVLGMVYYHAPASQRWWRAHLPALLFVAASLSILIPKWFFTDHRSMEQSMVVSKSFLHTLSQKLEGQTMGGYLWSEEALKTNYVDNFPALINYGGYIKHLGREKWAIPLHIPDSSFFWIPDIQYSPYFRFVKANPEREQPELAFLRKHKLGYVIMEPGVLPPLYLVEYATGVVEDPLSGSRVYLFDPGRPWPKTEGAPREDRE